MTRSGRARRRKALPQLGGGLFLTDGGIETSMIARERLELRDFAVFPLLDDVGGEAALRRYYEGYVAVARRHVTGLVLESATWRASSAWGDRLGYDAAALARLNRRAIELLARVRDGAGSRPSPIVLSGCIGPRRDGYDPAACMSAAAAEAYHAAQVATFAGTAADMVAALTLTYAEEAIGVVRAASRAGMPVAISFTVETDGRLASGQALDAAISQVDEATDAAAAYYMVNCAHPTHFAAALHPDGMTGARLHGLRANASRLSHAELDAAPEPDAGDPEELGREYVALRRLLPRLNVLGGCCGTDERHLECIAAACTPLWLRGGGPARP